MTEGVGLTARGESRGKDAKDSEKKIIGPCRKGAKVI